MERGVKTRLFLLVVLSVFFISLVSASFSFSNYSIETSYSKGSAISGFVNISFQDEPVTSIFEDSFGNKAFLGDLLGSSSGYLYNCSFLNCLPSYGASNPESSKSFQLQEGEKKTIGLLIEGNLEKVSSVSFSLTSDAPESDSNQIKIDILDDGIIDSGNSKAKSTSFGTPNFGCFNSSEGPVETSISLIPFCTQS